LYFISEGGLKRLWISKFRIFGMHIFRPILMFFFFEMIKLRSVVCQQFSSISYGFINKLNRKGPTKTQFQNLNFFISVVAFMWKSVFFTRTFRQWCKFSVPRIFFTQIPCSHVMQIWLCLSHNDLPFSFPFLKSCINNRKNCFEWLNSG
jgi:hypothetical protein